MLSFDSVGFRSIGGKISLYLRLISVVIGKRRVNLGDREMPIPASDLIRVMPEFVPFDNTVNGNSRPRDPGPSASNVRTAHQQSIDFNTHTIYSFIIQRTGITLKLFAVGRGIFSVWN